MTFPSDIRGNAVFSECGNYRYALSRVWDTSLPAVMFIGLNPSTADATVNDPTVRRCIGFAHSWGYGTIYMMNLFAFRATNPKVMQAAERPIGPDTDVWLKRVWDRSKMHIAAWGANGGYLARDVFVPKKLDPHEIMLYCLGTTKGGMPRHPLYIKADTKPIPWIFR